MTTGEEPAPPRPASEASNDFLAWLSKVPDSRRRYEAATEELARAQELVRALSAIRSSTVAAEHESGRSVREISSDLKMSPARVHQLIQEGKGRAAGAPRRVRTAGVASDRSGARRAGSMPRPAEKKTEKKAEKKPQKQAATKAATKRRTAGTTATSERTSPPPKRKGAPKEGR
jgi:hypothetical protein